MLSVCVLSCFHHVPLCDPMDHGLPSLLCRWDSPGKKTGVDCHAVLQGIFPTQGLNPSCLHHMHWQEGSLPGKPNNTSRFIIFTHFYPHTSHICLPLKLMLFLFKMPPAFTDVSKGPTVFHSVNRKCILSLSHCLMNRCRWSGQIWVGMLLKNKNVFMGNLVLNHL